MFKVKETNVVCSGNAMEMCHTSRAQLQSYRSVEMKKYCLTYRCSDAMSKSSFRIFPFFNLITIPSSNNTFS